MTEKSRKLLWVEDDHDTIASVVFPLKKKGWQIAACVDYSSAKSLVDSNEEFDFFLIDLILPFSSSEFENESLTDNKIVHLGIDLIEHIRATRGEDAPIGVFSVVYDPVVDKRLNGLRVATRFAKGTASNAEICSTIERSVQQN